MTSATTSTTESTVTKPTDKPTTKGVARVVGVLFIIFVIIVMSIYGMNKKSSSGTTMESLQFIPIFTDRWTYVETGGKDFETKEILIDGVSLKYYISINNTDNPREVPATSEIKWGLPSNIKRVYFTLKDGQGLKQAEVPFNIK